MAKIGQPGSSKGQNIYLTDKNEAIVSALIASDILLIKRIHSRIEFFWISVNFSLFTTRLNTE